MAHSPGNSDALLHRSIESGRIHSAYLLSGPGEAPRTAALEFVRALACTGSGSKAEGRAASPEGRAQSDSKPCESCPDCRRSSEREAVDIDGSGKSGPLLRHVGDHPDLLWVERGASDTRVRIGQIRALQSAFRLRSSEGGRRAGVIADAEWLNQEAQNALLRLLEEPPERTTLVLVTASSAGLLATVRSRCQKVAFRPPANDLLGAPENRELVSRLETIRGASIPDLLDWAEEYRGARGPAVEGVQALLETSGAWLRARVKTSLGEGNAHVTPALDTYRVLSACRKSLVQRNANPQMVAERALLALREGVLR